MKTLRILAVTFAMLLVAISHSISADADLEAVLQKYGGWEGTRRIDRVALMSDQERGVLIQFYKDRIKMVEQKYRGDRGSSEPAIKALHYELRKLGDPEPLAEAVTMVVKGSVNSREFRDAVSDLHSSYRPEVLKELAPSIFVDEPLVMQDGGFSPKSYGIAVLMLQITSGARAFPPETRKWADENGMVLFDRSLPMVRKWWRENEAAFLAGEFDKVKPGENVRALAVMFQ
jgi:hypothetical protein